MRCRLAIVPLCGLILVASGCGGDSPTDGQRPLESTGVVTSGDGVGSIGDAVEVMASAPAQANSAACDVERQTLELATEAYTVLTGSPPTAESDLLDQGLIREPSTLFDLTAQGTLTPATGSPCT